MSSNKYPEYVEVDGVRYKINTDFRVALRCFEVIKDKDIDDFERALAIIYLLLGDIPNTDLQKLTELLSRYLSCGEQVKEDAGKKPDMDLLHDEKYIIASFMSDYHLDLAQVEYIHWYQFMTLLGGLTNDCILNRIRDIRTCDLKDYKGKAKDRMAKAKQQFALPIEYRESQEEIEAMAKFDALFDRNVNDLDKGDELLEDVEQ